MDNLLSVFPNFVTSDSIFQKMVSLGAPWTSSIAKSMDISYFTMHSGLSLPSFFVRSKISSSEVVDSQLIAQTLWDIYGQNWIRLWDSYILKYNPIDNYNLTESVTRDQRHNRTIERESTSSSEANGTENSTVQSTGTNNLKHGEIIDGTMSITQNNEQHSTNALEHGEIISRADTTDESTYGFNSSDASPTSKIQVTSSDDHSGTDTTTNDSALTDTKIQTSKESHSGSDETTISDNSTSDLTTKDSQSIESKDDTTDNSSLDESISRTRSGNIGQSSYQDLLSKEFELWKWNFFEQVFSDCDTFMCLSVFSCGGI